MDLLFLGRGNSSNAHEGNTAAYFMEDRHLFLIDCGETIFSKIISLELLKDIDEIHVIITHTHSDHVGSLGSFIMYCYYNVHKKFHFILPNDALHMNNIITLLKSVGCSQEMYDIVDVEDYDYQFESFDKIRYRLTKHVDYLDCYSIFFYTKKGCIYYSGDSCNMENIDWLLSQNIQVDKLYVDVTNRDFPGNIHLYIGELYQHLPKELFHKVYCMHFNDSDCLKQALNYGFHVVELTEKK